MKTFRDFINEQEAIGATNVDRTGKMSRPEINRAQTTYINDVIRSERNATRQGIAPAVADDMTPGERQKFNRTQDINATIKSPASIKGQIDARTGKPPEPVKPVQLPLTGPTTQGASNVDRTGKGSMLPPKPSVVTTANNTTTVQKTPSQY